MVWLEKPDWDKFSELHYKLEGTTWYDTRELALMVVGRFDSDLEGKLRKGNETVTRILQVALEIMPRKEICSSIRKREAEVA